MPTIESAKKRLRQSRKRQQHNKAIKSQIRTRMKRLLATEDRSAAEEQLPELYALLDRAAGKDVIHPNKAAREKSKAARHVERL